MTKEKIEDKKEEKETWVDKNAREDLKRFDKIVEDLKFN